MRKKKMIAISLTEEQRQLMKKRGSLCGYLGNEEHITIPSEIEGKEVREVACLNETGYGGVDFFGNDRPTSDKVQPIETTVKRITFPDTVKRIGNYTFWECRSLEQADLPQNLITIGKGAFGQCEHLTLEEFPQSVKTIGAMAFEATSVTKPNLPEGLEYIGSAAFAYSAMTAAIIPDTVKYLGYAAFSDCTKLEYVKLPKGIESLSQSLFAGCTSLKTADIPEGVSIIELNAFGSCTSLEEIHFPSTVISVKDIFYRTSSLKDIYFAADKKFVDAFKSVKIDDGLWYIEDTEDANLMSIMVWPFDKETDYSGVNIHYGEKLQAEEKTAEEQVRTVFVILTSVFVLALVIILCLYLSQKIQNNRHRAEENAKHVSRISQGNALTRFDPFEGMRCTKCGAENGEKAGYCYNCGKKLNYRSSKNKGKEN
ncbi:MAG: leucine-rich repeat protein, partial [Ruminiclostridium sp.]|nr:leucine-rich repeat protein [Ruminiclostridium sp.]